MFRARGTEGFNAGGCEVHVVWNARVRERVEAVYICEAGPLVAARDAEEREEGCSDVGEGGVRRDEV